MRQSKIPAPCLSVPHMYTQQNAHSQHIITVAKSSRHTHMYTGTCTGRGLEHQLASGARDRGGGGVTSSSRRTSRSDVGRRLIHGQHIRAAATPARTRRTTALRHDSMMRWFPFCTAVPAAMIRRLYTYSRDMPLSIASACRAMVVNNSLPVFFFF